MIPTYLNNLVLEKVFASYCSNTDQYILESTSDEHVVDSDAQKISGFVTDSFGQIENETNKFFAVETPNGGRYALLQIDNGIIQTHSTKKCDCIIGFIELGVLPSMVLREGLTWRTSGLRTSC